MIPHFSDILFRMTAKQFTRFLKISLLCLAGVGGNYILNYLCVFIMKFPMFLDTVFTAAVTFSAGLIPGLVTALLSYIAFCVRDDTFFHPFILCGIAEVIILWRFKPDQHDKKFPEKFLVASTDMKVTATIRVFAKLMVLYVLCCLTVSVLGGIIDFFFFGLGANPKLYFSAEDTFKMGLLRSGVPLLTMDILSRIPVNIVDRFIVVFGGYFISRLMIKIIRA